MMFSGLLLEVVKKHQGSTAWIDERGRLSWQDIADRARQTAAELSEAGVSSADIVVTQLSNGLPAVINSLAINSLGASESPVDMRLGQEFALHAAEKLNSRYVIRESGIQQLELHPENRQNCWPRVDEATLILWTSGTTSEPKAVVITWSGVLENAKGKLSAAAQTNDDRRLTVLPLSHAYARTCDFATWLITGGILSAGNGWDGIERLGPIVRPTLMNAVPYLIDKVLGPELCHVDGGLSEAARVQERLEQLGLDGLRILGCGGAALSESRFEQIKRLGIAPIQGYGLTETSPVICSASPEDARTGVVGRPIPGTEVRISDDGEIQCRGPGVMRGYWGDRAATAKRITEDGWFRTGDCGRFESDGMLKVSGRQDEAVVLSTGYKFWPLELEQRLSGIAGVRHVILRGNGTGLEAIIDAVEGISDEVLWQGLRKCQTEFPREPRIISLRRLSVPLSVETGELTVKNTVRRQVVLSRLKPMQ